MSRIAPYPFLSDIISRVMLADGELGMRFDKEAWFALVEVQRNEDRFALRYFPSDRSHRAFMTAVWTVHQNMATTEYHEATKALLNAYDLLLVDMTDFAWER
jgi:hypothetical protein